ncbi:hypothetical protein JXJ21_10665 [candidate division KSB1 bacterium]|nr:hypothetical protein [candidate division KSB1 bacterium]
MPNSNKSYIFVLIISLVIVLGLIYAFQSYEPKENTSYDNDLISVTDKSYYNKLYRFRISVPTTDWTITYYGDIDSLKPEQTELGILNNINLMVKFERTHQDSLLAFVDVGIIDLIQPEVPHLLAKQCLDEMKSTYTDSNQKPAIIKNVTQVSSGSLHGAYFVVDLPGSNYPYPRWIVTFVIKDYYAYSIICQVSKEEYAFFREDFETIIASFNFI